MSKIFLLNQPGKVFVKNEKKVLYDMNGKVIFEERKPTVKFVVHRRVKKDFSFCAKHQLFDVINRMIEQNLVIPIKQP